MSQVTDSRVEPTKSAGGALRSDLRASLSDGIAFGGMVGLGETYLPAFVLAVGLGELTAGMVASVPLVAGGIMQMASPAAIRRIGSHKRWVVFCATIQALTFVPLVLAACWGRISSGMVLAVMAVYWSAGLAGGPAWNTWIGTLVPRPVRPRFFAVRTRASQGGVFLGFLLGGVTLQVASRSGSALIAFAALFAVAGLCRLVSVAMLARQSEPIPIPANMRAIPWRKIVHHLSEGPSGRLLVYLAVVQGSVQMAGPYFAPFMFEKLQLSYVQFAGLVSVAFIAKIVAVPVWGRIATQVGARQLLWIGGIGLVPLSAGWVVSQHLAWLVVVQVLSGTIWAAYELAFFLLFFESISEEERTSVLTIYNLINTVAAVTGALLGGALLWTGGASFASYLWIFGFSSVGRAVALVLLARATTREVEAAEFGLRTIAVRPDSSTMDAPVLPSLPDQVGELAV
jgi:MFS family permease